MSSESERGVLHWLNRVAFEQWCQEQQMDPESMEAAVAYEETFE